MIKQNTIEKIISTVKIEEVVGEFVTLKRRGVNMLGLCPFHDEKTPSFTVSPAKNIYKCFGCGKGGDPIRFVMDHEAMNYPESLRYLASKYNIDIEETENTAEQKAIKELNDSYFIINEYAQNYFNNQLFNTDEGKSVGLSYYKERGYNEAIIKKFQLGYTSNQRDDFTQSAIVKRYNIDFLKSLGLTSKMGFDFFRSRVMFTIHNLSGKVIAFAGRTLSTDKKTPKYINSPETVIYTKRKVLYGMYFAKQSIRQHDECVMVEGYTDVITLHQYGVENVVASSGTSLTIEQINLVRRFTQNIKIIYDGDAAGIKAALRGLDLVLEQDMNVKLVLLPEGEDPDSFMKSKGIEGFRAYLVEHEEDFVLFKTNLLLKEAGDDPIKKSIVLKDIVQSIAKIPDMIKRQLYIQKCSAMMGIAERIIITEINKVIKADRKQKQAVYDRERAKQAGREEDQISTAPQERGYQNEPTLLTGDDFQEKDLLRVLISHGNLAFNDESNDTVAVFIIDMIRDQIDKIDNALYREMFSIIIDQVDKDGKINTNYFINNDNETMRNQCIDFLSSPYSYASWENKGLLLQTQKDPEHNQEMDAVQSLRRFLLRKSEKEIKLLELKIIEFSNQPKTESQEKTLSTYIKAYKMAQSQRSELASKMGSVFLK
ncbi:MAG: DNA primase [Saprospiraceae bacterium]